MNMLPVCGTAGTPGIVEDSFALVAKLSHDNYQATAKVTIT